MQINKLHKLWSSYYIILLCLLGSLVRILFGLEFHPWYTAPDHLAWDLVIDQNNYSYDQLIHYPHEGGSIIISLLARIVNPLAEISALTIIALLLDFLVRYIQIRIVAKLFDKRIALFFAFWTILASPIILPWGTVNFGLHYISSLFPFVLLLLVSNYNESRKQNCLLGLFLGLAIWFSYSNVILALAAFVFVLARRTRLKAIAEVLICFGAIIGLHALVRIYADPGFQLNGFGLGTVRGESFALSDIDLLSVIADFPQVLLNGLIALPNDNLGIPFMFYILLVFLFISILGFVLRKRTDSIAFITKTAFLMVVAYLLLYLISPFYFEESSGNYVMYRHLTYITPLIAMLLIVGVQRLKPIASVILILVLSVNTSFVFNSEKMEPNDMTAKATGWVLGTKLGHSPETLIEIVNDNTEIKHLLVEGIAWGTCNALFLSIESAEELQNKTDQLIELMHEYPPEFHAAFYAGVEFAFSAMVTPRLPEKHLNFIKQGLIDHSQLELETQNITE